MSYEKNSHQNPPSDVPNSNESTPESESESQLQVATFGLGCFWGAQVAFARVAGVAGTKVGYTQGIQPNPTYEQVCDGKTRHREAVTVIYNHPDEVTYDELQGAFRAKTGDVVDYYLSPDAT